MIRQLNIDDIDNVNKMLSSHYLVSNNITLHPYNKGYVYEDGEMIVGYVEYAIIHDRAEINYIYVLDSYRNRKIATRLLNFMINEINKYNCVNISLEVNVNNIAAISFYHKNKFKEVAIRSKYYGSEDGILMVREMI